MKEKSGHNCGLRIRNGMSNWTHFSIFQVSLQSSTVPAHSFRFLDSFPSIMIYLSRLKSFSFFNKEIVLETVQNFSIDLSMYIVDI